MKCRNSSKRRRQTRIIVPNGQRRMHDARVRSLCLPLPFSRYVERKGRDRAWRRRERASEGENERVSRLTLCCERGRLQQAASNLSKEGTGPTGVELNGTTLESFGDSGATRTAKARIAAAAGGLCEGIEVGLVEKEKTAERKKKEKSNSRVGGGGVRRPQGARRGAMVREGTTRT